MNCTFFALQSGKNLAFQRKPRALYLSVFCLCYNADPRQVQARILELNSASCSRSTLKNPSPRLAPKMESIASFVAGDPFRSLAVYNSCMGWRIQRVCTLAVFPPFGTMWKRAISFIVVLSSLAAASAAAQSVVPDSTPAVSPAKPGLFDRVISSQKRNEEALDVYERMERLARTAATQPRRR